MGDTLHQDRAGRAFLTAQQAKEGSGGEAESLVWLLEPSWKGAAKSPGLRGSSGVSHGLGVFPTVPHTKQETGLSGELRVEPGWAQQPSRGYRESWAG